MVLHPKKKYGGILITEADKEAGEEFDIIAAITETGTCPFWDEFFSPLMSSYNESMKKSISFNKKDQINYRVLKQYFERFCKTGPWNNKRQLRQIENGFFEFKCIETSLRVIFYYDEKNRKVIVITHYFDKGGNDKTPKKEKERMYDIKKGFERRRNTEDNNHA